MRVLGIETSCDETAVAVYDCDKGLLAHQIFSQKTHADYGGVVPELASRDHVQKLLPMVQHLLETTGSSKDNIDGIAYTAGPGLIGALMVGAVFARGLSFAWGKPAIGVHHLEGHLLAPMLEQKAPTFPFVALLVSGGHTQLFQVNKIGEYLLLGESLDDAAGEAFDKTAKLLSLPYPGGPHLAKLAESGQPQFTFPRPLLNQGLDFSFSGLKTAVANTIAKESKDIETKANIAFAFEEAVVETLIVKSLRALSQTGLNQLVVAGGVSANKKLRRTLDDLEVQKNLKIFYPSPQFCTDNAAMIALAGAKRLSKGEQDDSTIDVRARWPLTTLNPID